jgi:hypothetical protein
MSWETFYLGCFWIGFLFSALSLLAGFGVLHLPALHVHTPHGGSQNSPINFGTVVIFFAWFGATGYLLTRYSNIWALLALGVAFLSGVGGATAMFLFLVKIVLADEKPLDPADYEMIGVLGRVSSPVRQGGTGEMIFSQAGSRRAAAIRSENGETISKGEEVVVTRFERGVAFVRRWEELSETGGPNSEDQKEK